MVINKDLGRFIVRDSVSSGCGSTYTFPIGLDIPRMDIHGRSSYLGRAMFLR